MDIRHFFDKFIDTSSFTDDQLRQLLQAEKERSEFKRIVAFNKKTLQLEEGK
ncbi:hypothetical protein HPT25_28100 [Bacillus sp. BRMEA1]|uniref:hypothetical protein n=1 Tax=Neobacillus endophyticus TaxID=2738405 RepID=UPI0015654BE3|nr:hypothetical protein [Neobacillus endophyticus]NRD81158.1 hypothetical protein [Neobacillus endophyticus]